MNNNKEYDFQKIHDKYFQKISNYIKYRVNDQEAAVELSQEVFLSMWQYMKNGNNDRIKNKKRFLYAIARNKVIDYYRGRKYETSIDDAEEFYLITEAKQEKDMDKNINMGIIKKIMNELDDKYKKVITYRYLEQMSIDEICRATGKSPNHVSVLIHQGLKLLEKKFKQFHAV
jgi:RNA polymerase sigma-70 factor, ECF subfamily